MKRRLTAITLAAIMAWPVGSSVAGPLDRSALTSETAKRVSREKLEELIGANLGRQLTLVDVKQRDFSFEATMRLPAHADGPFCSASQLNIWFVPEPNLAPPGTAPGAIHISRLPMSGRDIEAVQVYLLYRQRLSEWERSVEPDPCEAVDLTLPFFAAENAQVAHEALAAFQKLVRVAENGARPLRLDCGGRDEDRCRQQMAVLQPDAIEAVSNHCRGQTISSGERCFNIGLRTTQVNDHSHSYRTLQIVLSDTETSSEQEVERVRFISGYSTS